eukprot:gene24938-31336_t
MSFDMTCSFADFVGTGMVPPAIVGDQTFYSAGPELDQRDLNFTPIDMFPPVDEADDQQQQQQSQGEVNQPQPSELDIRWTPSLTLRFAIRDAKAHFGHGTEECRRAMQTAVLQYFQECMPDQYLISQARNGRTKTVTPSVLNHQSVNDMFLGATSRSVMMVDVNKWSDNQVLPVANVFHESKTFQHGVTDARKYVHNRLNDPNTLAESTTIFAFRDLGSISYQDILHQQPTDLRKWLLSLRVLYDSDTDNPDSLWSRADRIASFEEGPLDTNTMLEKQHLCDDAWTRLRAFISLAQPHPAMLITLLLEPESLTDKDALAFALNFKIPGVRDSSPPDVVENACRETGRAYMQEYYHWTDDAKNLDRVQDSWLPGIYMFFTFFLNQYQNHEAMHRFIAAPKRVQLGWICDQVSIFARSDRCNIESADWLQANDQFYEYFHAVLRLFNAFLPHATEGR